MEQLKSFPNEAPIYSHLKDWPILIIQIARQLKYLISQLVQLPLLLKLFASIQIIVQNRYIKTLLVTFTQEFACLIYFIS